MDQLNQALNNWAKEPDNTVDEFVKSGSLSIIFTLILL